MSNKIEKQIKKISDLVSELKIYHKQKEEFEEKLNNLNTDFNQSKVGEKGYKKKVKKVKGGQEIEKYNDKIIKTLEEIKKNNNFNELFSEKKKFKFLEEKKFDDEKLIKDFVRSYKKKKIKPKKIKYVTYKTNFYNVFANRLFGEFSKKIIRKYPKYFSDLQKSLKLANLRIFSNTYVSVGVLSALITFFIIFNLSIILFMDFSILGFLRHIALSFLISLIVIVGLYYYPRLIMDTRQREIKQVMPFAIIHMAAVAGSGAQLSTVFSMLLESKEYKGLEGEIKRIMNYVNLFGYNMTTALRSVANTTPSPELKELLNGLIETVESGGSMKIYLKNKAEDIMITYKLERKKYVETLSTYSDIYTAILIAAPLLFIIVLVLLSIIGNKIGGVDIGFIEKLGTFVVVPALNIAFIMFLNMVQPEM